ncbi:hypothetical protein KKB11_04740 [Candidatus Micrarchaeota archaeon]|nr:hypothetical protein [Candidatus Micrarchaeota archaeon]
MKKEDEINKVRYFVEEKRVIISIPLEERKIQKIYETLIDFCEELDGKYFKAKFFVNEKEFHKIIQQNTSYGKILRKAKFIGFCNEYRTGEKVIKEYSLHYKFNKKFFEWFSNKFNLSGESEAEIFNSKNKLIAEFPMESIAILHNVNKKQIKDLKSKIKEAGLE